MPEPQEVHSVAKRVLDRIAGERLSPRPRWEFVFKNYVFWTMGGLAVIVGALAFSAALFEIANAGWAYYAATHEDFLTFFMEAAPLLWLFVLALFVLIGYVNIRRTERGYRYPLAVIAIGAVLTSITLGVAVYASGFGGEIEEAIGDHPPFYRPILEAERGWWLAPGKGLLGGTVISTGSSTNSFVLKDFSGHRWVIDAADLGGHDLIALARGGAVRIVGVPTAATRTATSSFFHACFVFPWPSYGVFSGPPPAPVTVISSSSERSAPPARSEVCKGIRPYEVLHTLDENGF